MHIADIFSKEKGLREKARLIRAEPDTVFPVLSAKLKLTWRCNLRCELCSIWQKPAERGLSHDDLQPELVEQIISALHKRGLRKVHFSGGEVLLLKSFPRLVAFARGLDLQVNLTTNGTLLDKDLARFLVESRVHAVTVSIDSGDEAQHDKMRGMKGAWKLAWRGLENLRERAGKKGRGPTLAVNTIVTRQNVPNLDALFGLLKERGVDRWRLLPVDTPLKKPRPTEAQWRELRRRFETDWQPLLSRLPIDWTSDRSAALAGKGKYAGEFYQDTVCFSPWFNLFIDADGMTYPCCMGKGSLPAYGNVLATSLPELLAGRRRREICYSMASGHLFPICKCCDDFLEENLAFGELMPKEERS
jgi:MoaA/NifB/PqqE/SkfB family radical SAM enzyme